MKRLSLLLMMLTLLSVVGAAEEPKFKVPAGAIILTFHLEVTLGSRDVEARPIVAVANGKEASLEIMSDEESQEYLRIVVTPTLSKNGQVQLQMLVRTKLKDREVERKMTVSTLLGTEAAYGVKDDMNQESFDFKVTPTLAD